MQDGATGVQVSRRINDWCWGHGSNGFAVILLTSAIFDVALLAGVVAALAAVLLAGTIATTFAVALLASVVAALAAVLLAGAIALATLAAIAALVASEDAI